MSFDIMDTVEEIFGAKVPRCMDCDVRLKNPNVDVVTFAGTFNDSHGRCGICKAVKHLNDTNLWNALLKQMNAEWADGRGDAIEPDDSRYVN